MQMKSIRVRAWLCLVIIVAFLVSWIYIAFLFGNGFMTAGGIRSLRYFTILSNLMEGIASVLYLWDTRFGNRTAGLRTEQFKYIAAVAVGLTFAVVMVFLGPLFGYVDMLAGPNFWLHMALPLMAAAEQIFLREEAFGKRENLVAVLPMVLYGVGYFTNIMINGPGSGKDTNDWYAFLIFGYKGIPAVFLVVGLLTYGIGLILRKGNEVFRSRKRTKLFP